MHLKIITPAGIRHEGDVERFQFTSATGMMEFLPGHAPMIAAIREGSIVTDGGDITCGDGVVKIKNDEITVVCE